MTDPVADQLGRATAALAQLKVTAAEQLAVADEQMTLLREGWIGPAADAFAPHHPALLRRAERMQAAIDAVYFRTGTTAHHYLMGTTR
ncbi:hypothetical protein [Nocardia wallacei]|uniref:hypothetical protein n=1 Tax=Nocardia wallacei TaxID=480035 RepID=UPI0024574FA5|nr:hypothetical protein [Nocardia wallacei]